MRYLEPLEKPVSNLVCSQRIDRAYSMGQQVAAVLSGRQAAFTAAPPMPEGSRGLRGKICVVVRDKHGRLETTLHSRLDNVVRNGITYLGWCDRVADGPVFADEAIFQGFPSKEEAWAYLAALGLAGCSATLDPVMA